jgi:hypothetical protein
VTLHPREVELVVERPTTTDGVGERVRLAARFEVPEGADGPSPQDLAQALDPRARTIALVRGADPAPASPTLSRTAAS